MHIRLRLTATHIRKWSITNGNGYVLEANGYALPKYDGYASTLVVLTATAIRKAKNYFQAQPNYTPTPQKKYHFHFAPRNAKPL